MNIWSNAERQIPRIICRNNEQLTGSTSFELFFSNHDQIFFGTFDRIVGECKNLLAKNQADMNG
jgi:hypothetical protein